MLASLLASALPALRRGHEKFCLAQCPSHMNVLRSAEEALAKCTTVLLKHGDLLTRSWILKKRGRSGVSFLFSAEFESLKIATN